MSNHHARSPEMDRRLFLRRLGIAAGAAALAGIGYEVDSLASGGASVAARTGPGTKPTSSAASTSFPPPTTTVPPGVLPDLPKAEWVSEENARPGTIVWTQVGTDFQGQLEGYADRTSATRGDVVSVYVNTVSPKVKVEVYRMGWYGGHGGRLVHTSAWERGVTQPAPELTAGVNMVECHWSPTFSLEIGDDWPPGNYLLRLVSSDGLAEWVPLTIRDDQSTAAILVQNSVTTWQAYNLWGGYSLYYGQDPGGAGQSYDSRARVVSFDRPYSYHWAAGVADWLGDEFPLVMLAEKHGLDLAYGTDVDTHQHPERLLRHRCMISLGHDEYWSDEMRVGAFDALRSGVNLAFLGANACYRHIRFEASPTGPDRHEVCYKDGTEDPLNGVDNSAVTWNWEDGPDPRPESELIGSMYQSYLASGPIVAVDPSSWLLRGTGLAAGDKLPHVIGSEFDCYVPAIPGPHNLDVVFHSPTSSVSGQGFSDVTWYTIAGGGGVFASGTSAFVSRLWDNKGILPTAFAFEPVAGVTEPLTTMTLNLLSVIGEEPGSRSFPSTANWERFYQSSYAGVTSNDV